MKSREVCLNNLDEINTTNDEIINVLSDLISVFKKYVNGIEYDKNKYRKISLYSREGSLYPVLFSADHYLGIKQLLDGICSYHHLQEKGMIYLEWTKLKGQIQMKRKFM
ncbi:MAG: hypothetical protein ACLR60_18725 [Clostridium paraputrificum]